ncbi:MAG: DUF4276 family protein [Enhygromyxa sp.]
MTRLYIIVEGQTEERFCKKLLIPHLAEFNVFAQVSIVQTRNKQTGAVHGKGGGHWKTWKTHIKTLLTEQFHEDVRFTTMFDVYGLPLSFPGLQESRRFLDPGQRIRALEESLASDIDDRRIIPYLQRYEFETLVLAGLDHFESILESESLRGLKRLRAEIDGLPLEDINDGASTAPSKRLLRHIPTYSKRNNGPSITEAVGLEALRRSCPKFDAWISTLEKLATK